MQIISIDGWLYYFFNIVWAGFSVLTPVCLLVRWFGKNRAADEASNLQYAANFVIAIAAVLYSISWGMILIEAQRQGLSDSLFFTEDENGKRIIDWFSVYEVLFIVPALLLFIPKLRRSWVMTLLVLLALHVGTIVSFIVRLYSDYEPAEWRIADRGAYVINVLAFLLITAFFYGIMWKFNKLPRTSFLSARLRR